MLRTTLNMFAKSRQKILLKRRKAQLKNRQVSQKQLKQQRQKFNVPYQMKMLQIRKQMDKSKSPNHHLNQIIQDLFYPQIRINNEQQVQQRIKQMTSDAFSKEQMWEQMLKMDQITTQLLQSNLPLELLQVYNSKRQQFCIEHFKLLVQRLSYYCYKRQSIKQKRIQAWQKLMKKMKTKDPKFKQKRCPYLFLETQQIIKHHLWVQFVEGMLEKVSQEETVQNINKSIAILLKIHLTFKYMPAQLYLMILNKNLSIGIEDIRGQGVSNLLKLLKYRNKIKYTPSIRIQVPDEGTSKQNNHLSLARKLAAEVINNAENYTAEDLINIFSIIRSRKMRIKIIYQDQFTKIQNIISNLLGELSFQSVLNFFVVYCSLNYQPNLQFVEIIKYDLFRKAQQCTKHYCLLDLLFRIQQRKLIFKTSYLKNQQSKELVLEASDLVMKLTNVVTQMINKLLPLELVHLVDCYYNNDIRQQSLLQIVSTQIIRKGKQYTLQALSKSLFKLTLLGHRSKIIAKYLIQQFDSKYFDEMKKHKQKGSFLLPTEQPVSQVNMNFSEIYLQQCLLMMLWTVVKQMGNRLQQDIDLIKMFELFPTKIQSGDPLAYELALNINNQVKQLNYFPKINCPTLGEQSFPQGRLNQFYGKDLQKDELLQLMKQEAKLSNIFIANFNPISGLFLKQKWSKFNIYQQQEYLQFCLKQSSQNSQCFFDKNINLDAQFILKRNKIVKSIRDKYSKKSQNLKNSKDKSGSPKLYELL